MKQQPHFSELFSDLPGASLIRKGLDDLAAGTESNESLLVLIAAPRFRWLGMDIPKQPNADADRRLYARLCDSHGSDAYSQYNSLLRQLSSFARALERRCTAQ